MFQEVIRNWGSTGRKEYSESTYWIDFIK